MTLHEEALTRERAVVHSVSDMILMIRRLFIFTVLTSVCILLAISCDHNDELHRCSHGIGLYGGGETGEGEGNAELVWSPDGSKILFRVSRQKTVLVDLEDYPADWSVVEVNPLSELNAFDFDWSPDDDLVAFVTRGDTSYISLYDLNTSQVKQLTEGPWDLNPQWSSDGAWIAYYHQNRQLYLMRSDGTGVTHLTEDDVADARWSPDDSKIAFVSFDTPDDIFIIDSDGNNRKQLTDSPYCEALYSWSPDSEELAYLAAPEGTGAIHIMDVNTGSLRRLTNNEIKIGQMDWSSQGNQIVFVGNIGSRLREFTQELYIINSDGSGQALLTNTIEEQESLPRWSPNSQYIAFLSWDRPTWHLDLIHPDGSNRTRLASVTREE